MQKITLKPIHYAGEDIAFEDKQVLATYWGTFRGTDHEPISIIHAKCHKNEI